MREVIIQVSDKDFETYFKQDPAARELVRCRDCKYWRPNIQLGYDEDFGTYRNYCEKHMPQDEFEAEPWNAGQFCDKGIKRKVPKHGG